MGSRTRRAALLVGFSQVHRAPDRGLAELCRDLVEGVAEPLAAGALGVVEAELARGVARLELGGRDAAQPDAAALFRLDRDLAEQLDRGACEHAAVAGRRGQRRAPRDLPEIVVLDD